MSGSGATCFLIPDDPTDLDNAEALLHAAFPGSWTAKTMLGQAGFDPIGFSL